MTLRYSRCSTQIDATRRHATLQNVYELFFIF
jgi:hypothetical protein